MHRLPQALLPCFLLTWILASAWTHHALLGAHSPPPAVPAAPPEAHGNAPPAPARTLKPAVDRPLFFFDVGRAYHHLPECPPGWPRPGVGCDSPQCPVAWRWTNRSEADAVIFNTLDGMAGFGAPNVRARPSQQLVMFSMESGLYYSAMYKAKPVHGFNLSADYRTAADVTVPYYTAAEYGDLRDPAPSFSERRQDALVAVFISNCGAKNNRQAVLRDLIRLLPGQVHSYGRCEHNKDPDAVDRAKQKDEVFRRYKFAFTPENSNDEGYVTEKVYAALKAGAIPIYIGAPNIDQFIPNHDAVIRAADFPSVEELADYVAKVGSDPALYAKHTAWRALPQERWSKEWQALMRLQRYSSHCRIAMHIAGRPHRWREEAV